MTSPETAEYNCIAWAAGDTSRWWWPDSLESSYWPDDVQRSETLEAFVKAFETLSYTVCDAPEYEEGFEKIASYYLGGTYYRFGRDPARENFSIRRNFNPIEEEWNEEDFKDMGMLIYVNNTEHAEKIERMIRNAMPEIVLIRRREVSEKSDENKLQYSRVAA